MFLLWVFVFYFFFVIFSCMSREKFFFGLSRNIFLLGLVSLFTDLGSQMVFPLIPLFLTSVLGASAFSVGLIDGFSEAVASLFKVFSGFYSDKLSKRKPFVLFGYSLSSLAKPLIAFSSSWGMVLFFRVIERIGKGLRNAPRDAIVAESVNELNRGKAFGFHRAMDGIGSVLGAVLAFILLPLLGFRNIFLLAFFPGLLAVFFILFVQEKKKMSLKQEKVSFNFKFSDLPFNLKLFFVIASVFALSHFGYVFLLLKAKSIGLNNQVTIFLYVLFYLVYVFATIPFGILSDKIGRKNILLVGYFLFALISFALIFSHDFFSLLFLFLVYGVFFALIDGSQRAFVVDLAPKKLRATALGFFHSSVGLMVLPAGVIAGFLWDSFNPEATFLFSGLIALISFALFFLIKKN